MNAGRVSVLLSLCALAAGAARAQVSAAPISTRPYALVVGNSLGDLAERPIHGARALSTKLRTMGFEVSEVENVDRTALDSSIRILGEKGGTSPALLFAFFGHGFQINGENYLVPFGATLEHPAEAPVNLMALSRVFDAVANSSVPKVFVLDACRVNPFRNRPGLQAGWVDGLAQPSGAPANSLIAFSAGPGQLAEDGTFGTMSPYAKALVKHISSIGTPLAEVFERVRETVHDITDPEHTTWETSSLDIPGTSLRPPVFLTAQLLGGDDEVLVALNGMGAMSWGTDRNRSVRLGLREGDNLISVFVYNQKTYTGNNSIFGLPEGWNFNLDLKCGTDELGRYAAAEEVPSRDGPRHGKLFAVARIKVRLDPDTAEVSVVEADTDLWRNGGA